MVINFSGMSRKAQGLPINTVVLAGLAVLVLLLIAMFVTGGFGKIGSAIARFIGHKTPELPARIDECESYYSQWVSAGCSKTVGRIYCCKVFSWIDVDGDGYGDPVRDGWDSDADDYYNYTCDAKSTATTTAATKNLLGTRTCGSGTSTIDCSSIDC